MKRLTVALIKEFAKEERDRAVRDMDKTGDVDSYNYYQGQAEAYDTILNLTMKEN